MGSELMQITVYTDIGIYVLRNVEFWLLGTLPRTGGKVSRGAPVSARVAGDDPRQHQGHGRAREGRAVMLCGAVIRVAEWPMRRAEYLLCPVHETGGSPQAQRAVPGRFAMAVRAASSSANGEALAVPDAVSSSTTLAQDGSAELTL